MAKTNVASNKNIERLQRLIPHLAEAMQLRPAGTGQEQCYLQNTPGSGQGGVNSILFLAILFIEHLHF